MPHVQHVCLSNGNESDIKENSRYCVMTSGPFQPFNDDKGVTVPQVRNLYEGHVIYSQVY